MGETSARVSPVTTVVDQLVNHTQDALQQYMKAPLIRLYITDSSKRQHIRQRVWNS